MKSKLTAQVLVATMTIAGAVASPAMAQYSGQMPGQYSGQTPGQMPGQIPGQYSGQTPGQIPGQYSGQTPGQTPGQMPGQYSGQTPGQMPGQMSGQMSGQMPGQTSSQYMSGTGSSSTSFVCGSAGYDPATFVQVDGQILPSPLIIWQTESAGLSPLDRCQMVTQRFNMAVAQNGGLLTNLWLTTGKVNGYNVICFVNAAEDCNPSNVLMTLVRRGNRRNPGNILARIIRFGQTGGTGTAYESGVTGGENLIPTRVNLQEAINQLTAESRNRPVTPNQGGNYYNRNGGYNQNIQPTQTNPGTGMGRPRI